MAAFKLLALMLLLSGCVTLKCFSIDGKAVSWCQAKEAAKSFCNRDGELFDKYVSYSPGGSINCNKEGK